MCISFWWGILYCSQCELNLYIDSVNVLEAPTAHVGSDTHTHANECGRVSSTTLIDQTEL